jgi:hypothetical protein
MEFREEEKGCVLRPLVAASEACEGVAVVIGIRQGGEVAKLAKTT